MFKVFRKSLYCRRWGHVPELIPSANVGASRRYESTNENPDWDNAGLSYRLSPEQTAIKETAKKFAKEVIIPKAAFYDQRSEFSHELLNEMFKMGYTYPYVSTKYGGAGTSKFGIGTVNTGLTFECISYGCGAQGTILGGTVLSQLALIFGGNEEQKKNYLGRLTEEPIIAACCVTESQGGSDVSSTRTKAEKKGDNYVLNGTKCWITNAGVANWYYVLARTDDTASPGKAFTGFIVDANTPGISVGKNENKLGIRSSDTRSITFDDCVVPKENVLKAEGAGFEITMAAFDTNRANVGSSAIGVAQRALEEATAYAMERVVFGKPIIQHQAVSSMLAKMEYHIQAGRLLTNRAQWEIENEGVSAYWPSLCKAFCGELVNKVTADAVQIFGANGFSEDYPVAKLMRDAKINSIYEGTTQIQHMIIAREMIKKHKEGKLGWE